jgi:two-component system, OmpR family, response regulator
MNDKRKILIVDDDPDILETFRFFLEVSDFEVLTAQNGYEAYGAARSTLPDLIVLDVMLPYKNGYEVCRILKEHIRKGIVSKNIPIIILTGRQIDNSKEESIIKTWSQADEHLFKPVEMDHLVERINYLLNASL